MTEKRHLPAAMWPAAGLLGLVIPLSFIERIQSYLFYLSPGELWPVFGTTFLVYLPFAAALWLLTVLVRQLLLYLPAPWQVRFGGDSAAGAMLLTGVLAFGLNYGLATWLEQVDPGGAIAKHLPQYRWVVGGAMLLVALWPAARRTVTGLSSLACGAALLGLCAALSLPLSGWHSALPIRHQADAGRPNVLLITFDALTASHMSLYGYGRQTTPELDRIAANGVAFERFYAASNFTTSGVNSLLSGALPSQHRATQLLSWPLQPYRDHSLPAMLQQAGYHTYAVSTNPLAGPYKNGYGACFDAVASDRIYTYFSGRDGPSRWLKYLGPVLDNPIINTLWRPIGFARWAWRAQQDANRHYEPDRAFDAARSMIRGRPDGPLFIWLHLLPPHSPYAAPVPFLGSFDARPELRSGADSTPPFMFEWADVPPAMRDLYVARYDESLRYLDARAGSFLAWAKKALGANTVVMISSDHGESFTHGYGGHAGPLLTEQLVRIPLIVSGPGMAAGTRARTVASQIDLAPTIAALTGASRPTQWQGRSLLPELQGHADANATQQAWTMNLEQNPRTAPLRQGSIALITARWKFIHYLGTPHYPKAPAFNDQLFDLEADADESRNLIGAQRDQSDSMRTEVARFIASSQPESP